MSTSVTNSDRSVVVIPARLASTRLPRKLLLRETGKSVLQHTYEGTRQATRPEAVWVAADDEEIAAEVRRFGGQVQMTSVDCASGTDRVAEVAQSLADCEIVVNVQGDEPEISGAAIDQLIDLLAADRSASMATLATPIRSAAQLNDPACVKVVTDAHGRALYFSRCPIPHARTPDADLFDRDSPVYFQHIGLYAYRREFLLRLASLPPSPLERLECLEQLRVLENGHSILVSPIEEPSIGIDTPADYQAFVSRFLAGYDRDAA